MGKKSYKKTFSRKSRFTSGYDRGTPYNTKSGNVMVNSPRLNFRVGGRGIGYKGKVYYFKRSFETTTLTAAGAGGAAANAVYQLSLSNLPNVTDFTNLFDSYMIRKIKINFIPDLNMANAGTINPRINLYSVIDRNDASSLASVSEANEYSNCKRTTSTTNHVRYFRPSLPITVTDIASNTFIEENRPRWISTANTLPTHGIVKVISDTTLPSSSGTVNYNWRVFITYYIACKNVR